MDIRDLFKKQAERNKEQRSKRAPVIIEDEDDFKPSASKGGEGAKKSSQDGLKRKRGRARIKYMYESDSEEEAPPKKTKPSPKMGSGAARTDTKGQKRVATTPKRQEVKSVSAFFGSAPVKRSSDFKNSKSTADGGDSKKDGGRKGKEGKEGEEGKDTVICIPESPVDVTSHQFDEEVISEELHEDKDFNKTLQELDQQDLQPSPSTSQVGPPSKKLKLMMEKLPVRKPPSKKTPTKSTNNGDNDFTDSPVWEQGAQAVRRSPRVKGQQRNGSEKVTPSKPSQLVKKVGETDGTGKATATRGSKAKRGITYYDSPSEEGTNVLEESESKPVSGKKAKEVPSPSKQKKLQPAASSPSKPAVTSPSKPVASPLKPVASSPLKHDKPSSVPTKLSTTGTPKQDKPDTAASRKRDMASPVTPVPPKPSRSDSYRSYLNRSGPRAPGSKPIPEGEEDCLDGLTFVITGVLESMEREQASDLIKKYGGKVTVSVSKKTSYLVVGEDAGQSKLSKASQFGTKQISEDGLLDLIRTRPAKVAKKGAPPVKKGPPKKTAKQKSPTPFGISEPLTPKSHATPKSPVTTPTQSHMSTPVAMTTPKDLESLMWVDKYRPKSTKQIIGQQGEKSNAKKLARWLQNWERNYVQGGGRKVSGWGGRGGSQEDGSVFRAALLSGPPGVGKTTTAVLVCEEAGYTFVELNASATRSKRTLHEEVASHLGCLSLDAFVEGRGGGVATGKRHALIMDEVDGMAGNEDRGGVQELIAMIKATRVPIICICNDRQHPKIRSLANHCFDLRFYKPKVEQIRGTMMSVCYKEGVQIKPQALSEIIMASGQDVRQVLHNLCMWSAADKSLSFEQAKDAARGAKKEHKMGPFDVVKSVFMPVEGSRELTLNEKSDLFFNDYNIASLFVQENYTTVKPLNAKGNPFVTLDLIARTADSVCDGDLVERRIRAQSKWELLPLQAIFSSVLPGEYMRGYLGRPIFPQFLGNHSKRGRVDRTLQELQRHTRLVASCNKIEFGMDYLPFLHSKLTRPLIAEGSEGVGEVVATMENYELLREDWDSILELAQFTGRPEVASQIPSKVKAAFTRSYNKETHTTHYATVAMTKKSSRFSTTEYEGENEDYTSEQDSDGDVSVDPMIKTGKKKGVDSGEKKRAESSGKGKGRVGSQGHNKKGKTSTS